MTPVAEVDPVPAARTGLEVGEVTGWTFVFDRVARRLHRLNASAALVLDQLDGSRSLDELVAVLADHHGGADAAQIRRDVAAIIDQFAQEGLIEGIGPPASGPEARVPGLVPSTSAWAPLLARGFERRPGVIALGRYRAMGTVFAVTTDDDGVVEELQAILNSLASSGDEGGGPFGNPPLRSYHLRRPPEDGRWWRLYLDGTRIHRSSSRGAAVDHLLWHLNRMAVLSCPGDTVFHAAAAAGPSGAVLLPGVSNAGKSTLVTGLVESGLDYLSDEAVLLDAHGVLWPYPKAIDLDPGSWPVLSHLAPDADRAELHQKRWHLPPDRIRASPTSGPAPVAVIVAPRYEEGATPHLEPLPPEEAVALVLEQAFHLGEHPGALAQVTSLVESVPVRRLISGSLDGAVALVRRALEEVSPPQRRSGPGTATKGR